jgi:hypothetical protein
LRVIVEGEPVQDLRWSPLLCPRFVGDALMDPMKDQCWRPEFHRLYKAMVKAAKASANAKVKAARESRRELSRLLREAEKVPF